MNLFEKKYYWDEFLNLFHDCNVNYIGCKSSETRANNNKWIDELKISNTCKSYLIEYNYDNDIVELDGKSYDLKNELTFFIHQINKENSIILNITSMNLRLLGALLFNLKKLKFDRIYCIYTEPLKYCKKVDELDNHSFVDKFDLYKRVKGIEPIPGFITENDRKLSEKWVVFLGFEGKRAEQISEEFEMNDIVPVITLPSYRPGWHNYVLSENYELIKQADRKPEYIISNSYLSAYNYLNNILKASENTYIKVSPLGTKINALGALLFSLNNSDCIEILYDNPMAEGKISIESGRTYVFDISEVINLESKCN